MKYWSRSHTRDWICQIQHRLEDINYYLQETVRYCEQHGIVDDKDVITLSIMTCIWVSSMRNELITLSEVVDLLNLELEITSDKTYDLSREMRDLDFGEMLDLVSKKGPFLGYEK